MYRPSPTQGIPPHPDRHTDEDIDVELKGLLSGEQTPGKSLDNVEDAHDRPWSPKRMACVGLGLVLLILGASLAPPYLGLGSSNKSPHRNSLFNGAELRSNGTHDFKRTVLIVSIDGLRADYLDRGLTPHLLDISKEGLRAKFMKSVFPTLTFPNHWSLMTGLYAESHGIVGNNFWDPETNTEFHYNKEKSTWNPNWWFGEPMWETAGKAGIITANLMWPGPPKTMSGASSTYFVPWKNKVPLDNKLDQVMRWIDLPLEDRPQLIMAYEPSLDQAGHKAGPNSKLVNKTLAEVDLFAKNLHNSLAQRNLSDIVDIVFVSDHGMTDTSHPELVYMDDILGEEGLAAIEHEDGWPAMGLRFYPQTNASHYLDVLLNAAAANSEKFDVYTHETMPWRYHFSNHKRIAPIYVVPKIGYALTTKAEGDVGMTKGNHGYDNDEPSMYAMFVAHGPFSTNIKDVNNARSSLATRTASALLSRVPKHRKEWDFLSRPAYVMQGFENVEIYGLAMKLLGIEKEAAPTNGTAGFWDRYF
ncbi:Phosphodiest-domain-containing protein [Rickenella mellea]|uniref:Phosphodiest-domain-containing protein n=1 Tax=Rickenella mellea TaxID=50990 RepID=A0A4Y7Q4U4_9AGAM|nr:Phosphodiest-domain-containing protein [Rickenella mellea]